MHFEDRVFEQETVTLDGNSFIRCKFLECTLEFSAVAGVRLDDCLFRACEWSFIGAAGVMLNFLEASYRGGEEHSGVNLFELLVDAIKAGKITKSALLEPELVA
jgi:hypothetical protein